MGVARTVVGRQYRRRHTRHQSLAAHCTPREVRAKMQAAA
jgi:hypothetical protein